MQKPYWLEVLSSHGEFHMCSFRVGHGKQDSVQAAWKASVLPGSVRDDVSIPSPHPHSQWDLTGFRANLFSAVPSSPWSH